jgi:hypothetical protein
VLDYRKGRQLWDEVQAISDHKYGWGDGLPVEITPVKTHSAPESVALISKPSRRR